MNKKIQAFVEYKVQRTTGGEDVPDIFVIGNRHSFIEEKGSLPSRADLLEKEISQVIDYKREHVYEGTKFEPQVALMCPDETFSSRRIALQKYRKNLSIVSYAFPVEDPIIFKTCQGKLLDEKIVGTFNGREVVRQARAWVPKIRFLREKPPAPYTAWYIWLALWNYSSPSTIYKDFDVEYSSLLEHCRTFYPPWLTPESDQITQGRLEESLELLKYIGWVEFEHPLSPRTMILVRFRKGDKIRVETLEFLTKKYVLFDLGRARKSNRRKRKMVSARSLRIKPSGKNERLDSYLRT